MRGMSRIEMSAPINTILAWNLRSMTASKDVTVLEVFPLLRPLDLGADLVSDNTVHHNQHSRMPLSSMRKISGLETIAPAGMIMTAEVTPALTSKDFLEKDTTALEVLPRLRPLELRVNLLTHHNRHSLMSIACMQ
jgi:hypothetical protein